MQHYFSSISQTVFCRKTHCCIRSYSVRHGTFRKRHCTITCRCGFNNCKRNNTSCCGKSLRSAFSKKGAKLTCAVVPLLLASAVFLGSLPMRSFCSDSRLNALSSSLGIWLHRAVYDETTNSMPEGRLSPLRARNTSETPAIAVTSETIQSGYFRGMVGEVYTGTSWESLPNKELAKYNDLFYWLHSDGFLPNLN